MRSFGFEGAVIANNPHDRWRGNRRGGTNFNPRRPAGGRARQPDPNLVPKRPAGTDPKRLQRQLASAVRLTRR